MNPIAAIPIRSVAPTKKPAKKWEKKTRFSKHKQNPFAPEIKIPKQCKKKASMPKKPKGKTMSGDDVDRNSPNGVYDDASFDFSGVPPPYCSCSGFAKQCYKAAPGGWQSSCCTNTLSEYPLPWSPSKPRKRISGRKMSQGAYRKVLCRLAAEGHDLLLPVDLKDHWAKHGTNKFVTIK